MNALVVAELVAAVVVGLLFVRFWRQLVAALVVVLVTLSMIGLFTVISWIEHWPHAG